MRIGELSRTTGVSRRSLRYYEEQGLLSPKRLPSGYRVFDRSDVDAVQRIRHLLAAGIATATIADLLPCVRVEGQELAPTCTDALDRIRGERERLGRAIEELEASRRLLDAVLGAAARRGR